MVGLTNKIRESLIMNDTSRETKRAPSLSRHCWIGCHHRPQIIRDEPVVQILRRTIVREKWIGDLWPRMVQRYSFCFESAQYVPTFGCFNPCFPQLTEILDLPGQQAFARTLTHLSKFAMIAAPPRSSFLLSRYLSKKTVAAAKMTLTGLLVNDEHAGLLKL